MRMSWGKRIFWVGRILLDLHRFLMEIGVNLAPRGSLDRGLGPGPLEQG